MDRAFKVEAMARALQIVMGNPFDDWDNLTPSAAAEWREKGQEMVDELETVISYSDRWKVPEVA